MDNSIPQNPINIDDLQACFGRLNLNTDGERHDAATQITSGPDFSWVDDLLKTDDSEAGSSSFHGHPSMQFEASTSNPLTQFEASSSNPPTTKDFFCYPCMFDYITNNYTDYGMANYNFGQEIDTYEQIETELRRYRGRYLSMMTNKNTSGIFQELMEGRITDGQLNSIVVDLFSSPKLFVNAACCLQGFNSMAKLIIRLKTTVHASTLTRILSSRFVEMMTDNVGKDVIQQCFIHFGNQPNQILVERAIRHFPELAEDKVGCIAINEIISVMNYEQSSNLLNQVVDHSAYLADHPYGNYVVQKAMEIRDVKTRIVLRLKGEYVELAKSAGGSKVVEQCMKPPGNGLITVVNEILANPRTPFELAGNKYGNYVIQTALRKTKEYGFSVLHNSLVRDLLPHCDELSGTLGGQNVVNLVINDDGAMWMM